MIKGPFIKKDISAYQIVNTTLVRYTGSQSKETFIPYGVTKIGEKAFKDCNNLRTILIPETVEYIDHQAFQGCENLKYLNIPFSVKFIGDSVFDGCKKLRRLYIPDSVKKCHLLRNIQLDYLRIPISLFNTGIVYDCPFLCKHLALGLPDKEKDNGPSIEINYKLFDVFYTCPSISFEVPSTDYSEGIYGSYITIDGCVLGDASLETESLDEDPFGLRFVYCIPDHCLTVPSGVEVLDHHCVGESRPPLYIPDSVKNIEPEAFELWSKPIVVTPKANYNHLKNILPNKFTSPQSLSDIKIYVI